jgi:hypothetical protein
VLARAVPYASGLPAALFARQGCIPGKPPRRSTVMNSRVNWSRRRFLQNSAPAQSP